MPLLGRCLGNTSSAKPCMHSGSQQPVALQSLLLGEKVLRENELPGAILTRIAGSHIRMGTFEYASLHEDKDRHSDPPRLPRGPALPRNQG